MTLFRIGDLIQDALVQYWWPQLCWKRPSRMRPRGCQCRTTPSRMRPRGCQCWTRPSRMRPLVCQCWTRPSRKKPRGRQCWTRNFNVKIVSKKYFCNFGNFGWSELVILCSGLQGPGDSPWNSVDFAGKNRTYNFTRHLHQPYSPTSAFSKKIVLKNYV